MITRKYIQATAILAVAFLFISNAGAQVLPPRLLGTIGATGTHFEITDSDYLNIVLESSEKISLYMESAPEMITMAIKPASLASTTQLVISGLTPLTIYYKYQDDYHNLTTFVSDENGRYTYVQDLAKNHFVFIQPRRSTKFIADNPTGGDCYLIGSWNAATKTCTLTADFSETIQIDSDYITLDGNNHTITGSNTGHGVYLYQRTGIAVKNLKIKNFSFGIRAYYVNSTAVSNVFSSNRVGISFDFTSSSTLSDNSIQAVPSSYITTGISFGGDPSRPNSNNEITRNTITDTNYFGISISYSENTLIENNTLLNNSNFGVGLFSDNNIISDNSISGSYIGIYNGASYNKLFYNTIQAYPYAIRISGGDNQIYNNNFINNSLQFYGGSNNIFDLPLPVGGNYWSGYDTPTEGCTDINSNSICDSPYVFTGGQDNLPWTKQDGWKEPITLNEKAADLAKELVNSAYLYGGKGWDSNINQFVAPSIVKTGYNYWDNTSDAVKFAPGVDCSGLVMWTYNRSFDPTKSRFNNFVKAEGADEQFRENTTSTTEAEPEPGDVIFSDFNGDNFIDHVAMYVGESGGFDVVSAVDKKTGIVGRIKDDLKKPETGFVAFKRVVSALPPPVLVSAGSPVDLIVTDPDGFTITPTTIIPSELEFLRQIPGVLYYSEIELGPDGRPIDQVYSYVAKTGDYLIEVVPEPDALPTDTFSLTFTTDLATTTVLAENVPIADVPDQTFIVRSTEEGAEKVIPVKVRIAPKTLNLGSRGALSAMIEISKGFGVSIADIDTATIELQGAPAGRTLIAANKFLIAIFNTQDLEIEDFNEEFELKLTGELNDGTKFEGTDTVRIISRGRFSSLSFLLANLHEALSRLLELLPRL